MLTKQQRNEYNRLAGLMEEAMYGLKMPSGNANLGDLQAGGIYWRCCQVLDAMDKVLDFEEGVEHARFIRNTHGILIKLPNPPATPPTQPT